MKGVASFIHANEIFGVCFFLCIFPPANRTYEYTLLLLYVNHTTKKKTWRNLRKTHGDFVIEYGEIVGG